MNKAVFFDNTYTNDVELYKQLVKEKFVVLLVNCALDRPEYVSEKLSEFELPEDKGRTVIFFTKVESGSTELLKEIVRLVEQNEYMILASSVNRPEILSTPRGKALDSRFILTTEKSIVLKIFNHSRSKNY